MRPRLLMFAALCLTGCAVGPNYKRPPIPVPDTYRGASVPASTASLAETKWPDLFQDDALRQLITCGLEQNFDLIMAAERVQEARARFRIAFAEQVPSVSGGAQFLATRTSRVGSSLGASPASMDFSYTQAGLGMSWELDLWGRLRRLTESARAQFVASEEARHGIAVSLIADLASHYYTLRERDLELEIAQATRNIAERNLQLVRLRHDHGAATGLDVHQAEQLVFVTTARISEAERDIAHQENALNFLLGRLPGSITRPNAVDDFGLPAAIPAGLPSALLERRPDIRQAEALLVSANAQIGAAKANYFPNISLTSLMGGQSRALSNLLSGPASFLSVVPVANLPLFTAGQVGAGVRLTEAQKREMAANYQKTVYNAFREVSDALVRYDRTRQQRKQQDLLVSALAETDRLSNLRYQGGLDSYLQVLDAQRNLFQGRLTLAQLRLQELLSLVELYRTLGGGWQ